MVVGIKFHRKREKHIFKNLEETESCTLFLNDLFDLLNHKYPAEGIHGSKDFRFFYVKQNYMLHDKTFLFKCELKFHTCLKVARISKFVV